MTLSNLSRPELFLDAALMIAAIFSQNPASSPGYGLFKLGEASLIDLYTSEDALRETQGVLQELLGEDSERIKVILAENLAMANVQVTPPPSDSTVGKCIGMTNYAPDARVLAAAIDKNCEVFVTYDREHLLNKPKIGPPHTPIVVMSGGEAKAWAIDQISVRARLRAERKRNN